MSKSEDSLEGRRLRSAIAARLFARAPAPVVVGRYRLLELLGEGGMGVVYAAHDPHHHRNVALKLSRVHDRFAAARLVHEARALARIACPHVVAVHDVGEADGHPFCAMTLVEGSDLRHVAATLPHDPSARLRSVLALGAQVACGLASAHEAGVVHRDVKPRNILVDRDGHATIVDFGLASIDGDDPFDDVGAPGSSSSRAGTLAYMAPEQLAAADIDARCDQYSLCITLIELLRGRSLHLDDQLAAHERARRIHAAIDHIPVPFVTAATLHRGVAFDRDDRFADMHALASRLRDAPSTARGPRPRRLPRMHHVGRVATLASVP